MADVINIVLVYCEGQEIHCRQSMYDGTPENGTCATLTVVKATLTVVKDLCTQCIH